MYLAAGVAPARYSVEPAAPLSCPCLPETFDALPSLAVPSFELVLTTFAATVGIACVGFVPDPFMGYWPKGEMPLCRNAKMP